jgi:UDP-glucose 4-epimerase
MVARLFNTYGPYETNPHLIPHIIDSLREGGSVVPLGNVDTKRDYIYVEDVAELLVRLAGCAQGRFTVCNVGTGEEYSAREIVAALSDLLGRDLRIQIDAERVRASDKLHQRADTARLKRLSGSEAKHSLHEGLRRLVSHEGLLGATGG